jgi:hypothetical protein
MVCGKCEKKLTTVVVPDKWKDGALNIIDDTTGASKTGVRKLGANTLIAKRSGVAKSADIVARPCRICRCKVQQPHAHYCQGCAYSKGALRCPVHVACQRGNGVSLGGVWCDRHLRHVWSQGQVFTPRVVCVVCHHTV